MEKRNLILFLLLLIFLGCNEDVQQIEEANLKYSLISTDNVRIASSSHELNSKITNNLGTIKDVSYIKTDKKSVIAIIDYKINEEDLKVMLVSGIENFKFPYNAIIKLDSFTGNMTKTNENDDIYISCMGRSCCAPGGTYDPNTKLFSTSCKCDDNNNSDCIMRVSSKPPEIKQE